MRTLWEDVFDLSADSYDDPALRFFDLNAHALVRQVDVPEGASVLDVATGTGKVALEAARAVGPRGIVIGVDVSAKMLERAHRKASNLPVEFRQMDGTSLRFPDQTFDVVLCGHALTFLNGGMLSAVREFHRVLKPGGRVGVSDFTIEAFMPMSTMLLDRLQLPAPRTRLGGERWNALRERRAVLRLLKRGGFRQRRAVRQPTVYMLGSPEDCWTVLWGSAWRGPLSRLPSESLERVRRELLKDFRTLQTDEGIRLDASALIGVGLR